MITGTEPWRRSGRLRKKRGFRFGRQPVRRQQRAWQKLLCLFGPTFITLPLVLALMFVVTACGGGDPNAGLSPKPPEEQRAASPEAVVWNFYPGGLSLRFSVDPRLNPGRSQPHAAMVCVYQLNSINSVQALSQDPKGLAILLGCTKFDPSVVDARRVFFQPGAALTAKNFDRLAGANTVALVAGFIAPGGSTVCINQFPVRKYTEGVFFKDDLYTPEPLSLHVTLGTNYIGCLEIEQP